jgi:hypothetical protein
VGRGRGQRGRRRGEGQGGSPQHFSYTSEDNPSLVEKAIETLKEYGLGLSSVRFICGTQTIHKGNSFRSFDFAV